MVVVHRLARPDQLAPAVRLMRLEPDRVVLARAVQVTRAERDRVLRLRVAELRQRVRLDQQAPARAIRVEQERALVQAVRLRVVEPGRLVPVAER